MSLAELPATSDFYDLEAVLGDADRAYLATIRSFMQDEVAPIANDHWQREEFPHHLWKRMAELEMGGMALRGYGCAGRGPLVDGFLAMELAAVDCSVATGLGVHNHLAMGSIHHCGSEEQKERWLPSMARFDAIGAFALTEPDVGSGVARGLKTTARRDGDRWVLNGAKRWIGNATFADVIVVWARDEADDQVKAFLVERGTPGFETTKMTGKIALRAVQNADIVLTDVVVTEAARLEGANTFLDAAEVLTQSRIAVACEATGCARGAYELALAYAGEREQFGRPIAKFQLVQDLLARINSLIVGLAITGESAFAGPLRA